MTSTSSSAEERLGALSSGKAELLKLLLEQRSRQARHIAPYPRAANAPDVLLPASWAQQRLWFLDRLEGGGAAYHITVGIQLKGSLDRAALVRALQTLTERHEVLRTVFVAVQGEPRQEIHTAQPFVLREVDLTAYANEDREAQVRLHKSQEAHEKFDLRVGPVIRGRLLRVQAEEHVLLITMHHIVSDGWSTGVLIQELAELYSAYQEGRADPLGPLPVQYADYAQWQRAWLQGEVLERQLDYWRERLYGAAPQLELPTDRSRPAVQSYRGGNVPVILEKRLSSQLKAFAQRHEMTLFMVLYAGWAILLSRLSGQEDVVIGTPIANRRRPELEGLIGFFVNTLALRAEVRAESTVTEFLKQVKEVTLGAYSHQDAPFEKVVEALQPQRSLSRNPLFQVMLAVQNAPQHELRLSDLRATLHDELDDFSKFDLLLSLEERDEEIVGIANYAADLFDRDTVEQWMACFTSLLTGMMDNVHSCLDDLPLLPPGERQRILEFFNAPSSVYSQEETLLHELIEARAQQTPNALAVICDERQLTYAELNSQANQVAHALRGCGVGPDARVGLYVERSVEAVVGLLAILKAGGAYLPLDVSYPAERLKYMLTDSAPVALLTQERLKGTLPPIQARIISIDGDRSWIATESCGNPPPSELGLGPQHLAYVIYTSGSTGTPKGVMVTHRNIVSLIQWHRTAFELKEGLRCSCVASFGFDAAAWEIWPALSAGATLILASSATSRDPGTLLTWWSQQPLDLSFLPTPLAELAFSQKLENTHLRTLLVGGDRLRSRPRSTALALINNYGPTECTVVATSGRIDPHDPIFHIGRPIANTRIYILDRKRHPVPVGVIGEIHIGGAGVARGYLNQPVLTDERFIPDSFVTDADARMYMTGDLARWRNDGTIDYIGRNDHQVKIRGFRIELGEIEAQLLEHGQVSEAVVIAREDVPGEKRLAAYVVPPAQTTLNIDELREYLKTRIPEYMVPSTFVIMSSLPLTPNGKLDTRALPVPELDASITRQYEAPRGEVEVSLAEIWRQLLRVERVGRQDDFFELGGHSLHGVKLVAEIAERFHVDLSVTIVFQSPTIEQMALAIRSRQSMDPPFTGAHWSQIEEGIL